MTSKRPSGGSPHPDQRDHDHPAGIVPPEEQPGYELRIPDFFTGYATPVGRTAEEDHRPPGKRQIPKVDQVANNPCWEESKAAMRCLDENNYQQQFCTRYHENYTNCRKFWTRVYNDRRNKDLVPWLPPPEERRVMEEHYRKLWNM
ncbi:coiled-coil-helix-coiled-coil-helix domain-containing protein 7-like [Paramacrobiotus metropolitanus]|uniref:coiled-coil-helix-coiled-coil-helix domain-containing protein 7-like n=1 Tax=Paramacrobiotus metropolitanus TaxID=2943436 RepID=UPI0024463E31|nr:coiled-coil-helix-coiled-coil-helix domain-containing protein 7-like [Paramacrobiotus metropolitanus]